MPNPSDSELRPPPSKPRAPRKRAAAKSSSKEEVAEPTNIAVDAASESPKPRRRRSSKKASQAEGVAESGTEMPVSPEVADGAADVEGEAPKKKRRRRRRSSKKTSAEGAAAEGAGDGESADAGQEIEEAVKADLEPKDTKPRRAVPDLKGAGNRKRSGPRGRAAAEDALEESTQGTAAEEPAVRSEEDSAGDPETVLSKETWDEIFGESTFEDIGIRASIRKALDGQGFKSPTKIQAELIPLVLSGHDVLGQSRTGSGKTAAFGIPVINNAIRGVPFQTLILAPTRELAIQITDELRLFAKHTPIRVATVYGGQKIDAQARRLRNSPEIVVATPGRLFDMVERGHMHLDCVRFVVLDEVDRMLDIGFRDDIKAILKKITSPHQTIFVSATISPEIESLARTFMEENAQRIETTGGSLTVSLVKQFYVAVQPWDKSRMLVHIMRDEEPELAIVFCRMKRTVDKIMDRLNDKGIRAAAIHGDLPQGKRNRIIEQLRAGKLHVLVASDLAARGLDVDGITHVVNFDLPEDPEIYVHRIGRTARAGRGGKAFSLVTPEQGGLLTDIEKLANTHIPEQVYEDFKPGPEPDRVVQERRDKERQKETIRARKEQMSSPTEVPQNEAEIDPSLFPGGVVPSKLPPRRMGGRSSRVRR